MNSGANGGGIQPAQWPQITLIVVNNDSGAELTPQLQ